MKHQTRTYADDFTVTVTGPLTSDIKTNCPDESDWLSAAGIRDVFWCVAAGHFSGRHGWDCTDGELLCDAANHLRTAWAANKGDK